METETKYAPVLKWKTAEYTALKNVDESQKKMITPVAEIVLPSVSRHKDKDRKVSKTDAEMHSEMVDKLKTEKVHKISEEFVKAWKGNQIYVDVTHLHDEERTNALKVNILSTIVGDSNAKGVHAIPVVNLSDNNEIILGIKNIIGGEKADEICIRISVPNLKDVSDLNAKLATLIQEFGLSRDKIHLLVDLKYLNDSIDYGSLFSAAQKIEHLKKFHTFIFASGCFPVDMTDCPFEEPTYIDRLDWLNWNKYSKQQGVMRVPVYSDYSIRFPLYDGRLQFYESTSTIKYTLKNQWIIIKGKKRALDLYLVHASLFVTLPEFSEATYGEKGEFSYGDKCIEEKAAHFKPYSIAKQAGKNIRGTGTASLWIGYSMSHHFALVMRQLSSPAD